MRNIPAAITLMLLPFALLAQTGSRQSPDSVFSRAIALNNEQRGAEARALVDSVLRSTQPTASVYADALFWKGVLAESEQVAEESYKRIAQDFPLHRRAEESLIRLAQLEIMRGNRVLAQRYLDRIVVEHPYGQHRAKASYWRARLFFEENEIDRACAELGTARARLPDSDVELKTEIDYAAQRCANVPVPSTAGARAVGAVPPTGDRSSGEPPGRGARQGGRSAAAGSDSNRGVRGNTAAGAAAGRNTGAAAQTSRSGASAARGATDANRAATKVTPAKVMYSVQAAAFPSKANAEAFVEALKTRGYESRLVGTEPLYRVRLGRFETRAEATALAAELKSKRISSEAFVVEAEPR